MQREELEANFNQQAASYDARQAKVAPVRDGLHLLIQAVLSELPGDANILCVGAGTGAELVYLAEKFPRWHFTAVEPAASMLEVCRRRAEELGIAPRCQFHEGYLDSLPLSDLFDAATCLLVSQFILERDARSDFFRTIAQRLKPGGILASSDLASNVRSATYQSLLDVWFQMMKATDVSPEGFERMRTTYSRDVAVLPPDDIEAIIVAGGFEAPIQFFQAGLIHAWYSKRASNLT
ncbi:MAG: class I SAM-dependent methyltransferase [Gammaproteobacteria bacterium]